MTDTMNDGLTPMAPDAISATTPIAAVEKKKKVAPVTVNDRAPTKISLNVSNGMDPTDIHKHFFVKLPHSGYEFEVRGLLVEEEDALKSANTSPKRAGDMIMRTFWNCISSDIKKPDHPFGRFDTFCQSISLADRDTIAVAITQETYGATHDMVVTCPRCGKSFVENVCLNDCIDINIYNGPTPILQQRKVLELPELGWKIYMKIPTVADELATLANNSGSENGKENLAQRASDYIFIDKIELNENDDMSAHFDKTITNYIAIYGLIRKRPAIIRKLLAKEYEKFRGDWGINGKYETSCKYCDSPIEVRISPVSHFMFLCAN